MSTNAAADLCRFLRVQPKHHAADFCARFCAKNFVASFTDSFLWDFLFKQVHKKIGLNQNLIIHANDVVIGVVMANKITHLVDEVVFITQPNQQFLRDSRAFLLLEFSGAVMIFVFTVMDSDVMGKRATSSIFCISSGMLS